VGVADFATGMTRAGRNRSRASWHAACSGGDVAVREFRELFAWQLADGFKAEVFALVKGSARADADVRFRSQLLDAASAVDKDIAEGFMRCSPRQLVLFLGYAVGSLAEAELRLADGIALGYFSETSCAPAFRLAKRAAAAIAGLRRAQFRYLDEQRRRDVKRRDCP
jgi:four helix bundle protein